VVSALEFLCDFINEFSFTVEKEGNRWRYNCDIKYRTELNTTLED
jgi:hypothetical protein